MMLNALCLTLLSSYVICLRLTAVDYLITLTLFQDLADNTAILFLGAYN